MHLGPLLGLHRPTPALIHAILDHVAVIMDHWKKEGKIAACRPTPLVGRLRGSTPLFNPVHRELMALPLLEFHQFHFVFSAPLLSLLWFLSKFIRKRRKRFPSFAFSFASHLYFVFTFFSLQERVCGGTTTPQERFCGVSSPTRMILWSVM